MQTSQKGYSMDGITAFTIVFLCGLIGGFFAGLIIAKKEEKYKC